MKNIDIYTIAPINNLELMLLGDRIFALAHLYLKFPRYKEFLLARKKEGWFITLDNSAAERQLVTPEILIDICKELKPDEVIAPDHLFDKDATLESLEKFSADLAIAGLHDRVKIFGCPQGKTKEDWIECYKQMLDNNDVSVIGMSKIAIPQALGNSDGFDDQGIALSRNNMMGYLSTQGLLSKPLHMLGQGDPDEFLYYVGNYMSGMELVRSTDSVYPVLAGDLGQNFYRDEFKRTPTPHDYLEVAEIEQTEYPDILANVSYLRKQCQR